ncbi:MULTISPECIES: hypothetical protein [Niastella]|uniref:Uncharacterized protein n=1 Tax=Niastella soli TaxID=2821487 RepID=A0ABS3YRT0_9BACT|nr:hypothetical protein [Niastella soli]MBO9200585.1 hypothetical protein [Niastella soli]
MALNKDVLGAALYNKAGKYNEKDIDNIEQARQEFWKGVAEEIINHLKSNATLTVPGTGLVSPQGPVTGVSTTGTIL